MRGRCWLALVAVVLATAGTGADADGVRAPVASRTVGERATCELPRVDRARTPSTACMSCHDGTAGQAIPFEMRPTGKGGSGMSHPVNVDYGAAAAGNPSGYVPASQLPREVPLVNGRIECTTCHDGSLSTRKWVVDEMKLCYACHRM